MKKRAKTTGIILAGGLGTRLRPMTLVTNKHLLPVYDRPMIFYPLEMMANAEVRDVIIVTGPESAGDFMELIGDGSQFGLNVIYRLQKEADGIAGGIRVCRDWVPPENNIVVILGDNIYQERGMLCTALDLLEISDEPVKAHVFLTQVDDPERFGVAVVDYKKDITRFVEKPKEKISNMAVTGMYIYDKTVWEKIDKLGKSSRGEYEITDIQSAYLAEKGIEYTIFWSMWSDAGTPKSLLSTAKFMSEVDKQ